MKPVRIISGLQTGADQGGLFAAEHLGIPTGGVCPRGGRTEAGDRMDLVRRFGLEESSSRAYDVRTYENVRRATGTVIFGRVSESGSGLTQKICLVWGKPVVVEPTIEQLIAFLTTFRIEILNVAGNRESKMPGIQQRVCDLLVEALS